MTSTLGINSDVQDPVGHANEGVQFWGGHVFTFEAPTLTLNSILIEANAPALIDLLSLDAEWAELEILKGIDHSEYRFKYLMVESRQFEALNNFLVRKTIHLCNLLATKFIWSKII